MAIRKRDDLERPAARPAQGEVERAGKPDPAASAPPAAPVQKTTSAPGWRDPDPLVEPAAAPPVPLDAFPRALRDQILAVSRGVQAPLELCAIVALTTFATAAQRVARVRVRRLLEQLSLYCAGVASPSERKSPVYRAMTDPLFEWERQYNIRHADRIADVARERRSIEGRKKHFEAARNRSKTAADMTHWNEQITALERALPPELFPLQLTVGDVTVERMAEVMSQQGGCLALLSEEGGTFLNTLVGRYDSNGKTDLDAWLQGYDGGRIAVERMSRRVTIERPRMSIGLVIQPQILHDMAAQPQLEARGLMGRFCFVWGPSMVGQRFDLDAEVDPAAAVAYTHALHAVLELPPGDAELTLDEGARAIWDAYYLKIERALAGEWAGIEAWAGKHAGRAARIAAVFHLARWSARYSDARAFRHPIDAVTMRSAVKVADWLLGHQLAIVARTFHAGSGTARAMLEWARRSNMREVGGREFFRHFRRDLDAARQGLDELVARGWVRVEVGAGRNRTGSRVLFHPSLFPQD